MEKKLFSGIPQISDMINIVTVAIPVEQMLFNALIAIIASLMISWVYKKTYSGVIYSKNFNITLVLVSVVTSMVMMVIRGNMALSLGLVGALSIIRFRSALKDTRDIGFLFWGMSAGLAAGTGNHLIAIFGTIIIGILMYIMHMRPSNQFTYMLIIKGNNIPEDELNKCLNSFSQKYKLQMKNQDNSGYEMIYEIQIKKEEENSFVNTLKQIEGVKSVNLLSHKGELIG